MLKLNEILCVWDNKFKLVSIETIFEDNEPTSRYTLNDDLGSVVEIDVSKNKYWEFNSYNDVFSMFFDKEIYSGYYASDMVGDRLVEVI